MLIISSSTKSIIGRLIIFFTGTNLLTAVGQLATFVLVRAVTLLSRKIELHLKCVQFIVYPDKIHGMSVAYVVSRCKSRLRSLLPCAL
jgi:hypothetical protein